MTTVEKIAFLRDLNTVTADHLTAARQRVARLESKLDHAQADVIACEAAIQDTERRIAQLESDLD